jgi:hypothetical protein
VLGGEKENRVDAAIGKLRPKVRFARDICSIGAVTGTREVVDGMAVRKHGRTSGYTEGTVTDVAYDALVGMDRADPDVVGLFGDQIRIEPRAPHVSVGLAGDSGALVVTKRGRRAVGLYFANPPGGEYAVASPIAEVLARLEIQIL